MYPKQLLSHLIASIPHGRKTLIKGPPGCGKSDIVEQACHQLKADLLISHPAVSDPTDYKGMPAVTHGGTEAHFLPFGDLKRLIDADRPTVCFLDDIGQAPHGVQAALMQLILARRVNGFKISEHVTFIGATNDTSHRAGVHTILEPVKSRWDTIVELAPHLDDWSTWALDHGMPAEIIAFVRFRPELLCKFEPTRELVNSPSPRTIAAVGRWVSDGITNMEVLAGAAGQAFAAEFVGFLKIWQSLPSIDQILLDPMGAPVPTNPAALYAITAALVRKFTRDNAPRVFTYAGRLPKEFEVCLVRDALRVHSAVAETREFTEWAVKNSGVLN